MWSNWDVRVISPTQSPLAGRYLLREKLADKLADILPAVTSQKMRLSQDVAYNYYVQLEGTFFLLARILD